MALTDLSSKTRLPDGDLRSRGRRAVASMRDRVDRSTERLSSLSERVRRIGDQGIDDYVEKRLLDHWDEHPSENDPRDRTLEAFVRRYGLDEARLNERTIETIRDRSSAEAPFDPSLLSKHVETLLSEDEPSQRTLEEMGEESDEPIARAASWLVSELETDADRPFRSLLDDVLERDAVEMAHHVEDAVTALPSQSERGEQSMLGAASREGAQVAPMAALAAMQLLSDGHAGSDETAETVAGLVSGLVGAWDDTSEQPIERVLIGLVEELRHGELELPELRSGATGSRALVALFVANLVAMGIGAWVSYREAPPIPEEIRDPDGATIVTADRIRAGKKAFQANGLMNQGSILGNGSYFGVDLTAEALDLKAQYMREYYAKQEGAESVEALSPDRRAAIAERVERELDTEAPDGPIARYSAAAAYAHRRVREQYAERYHGGDPERGIPSGFVDSREQAEQIADFALWTAWMAHTDRPGSDHSYTNDWPYVPGTGNRPTGQVVVWSTISLVLLVGGGGLGVWAYHSLDFAEPTTELIDVPSPDSISVTPAQHAAAWYVPVAGALFVLQALTGALLAHYYVERTGFFGLGDALGIDIVSWLPFATVRTWHINLAVLWITTLWLAGGLFLPGLFSDDDPPWQATGATALLGLLVVTTLGAFAGVWLGTHGKLGSPEDGELWWWLGSEGLEYLEVGRFWKLLLLGAFAGWTGLVLRGVRRMDESPTGIGHFMAYAGGSIALLFGASMLYTPETNIAVTEFWRWWVVHMWVEGVFEFFVTAVVSVALVSMELVEKGDAEAAILFEVFAIMSAGIVGVSHHYWWVGLPDLWVPLGTTFSTLEFVPLVFVLYRAVGEYRSLRAQGEAFPYTIPFLFIVGSSVWNFVGGGVLGFFINLPVINYYEHGTYLTVAHAHAATFGAFGLLALGLGTYVLRVVTPGEVWDPTWFRGTFWLTNVGLAVMVCASLLPIGFAQLRVAYSEGYAVARSLEFYERPRIQALLWVRTLGDTPMILGALAFTVGAVKHLHEGRRFQESPS